MIEEMIDKYEITVVNWGKNIQVCNHPTDEDATWIKAHKQEIIDYLEAKSQRYYAWLTEGSEHRHSFFVVRLDDGNPEQWIDDREPLDEQIAAIATRIGTSAEYVRECYDKSLAPKKIPTAEEQKDMDERLRVAEMVEQMQASDFGQ